MAVVSAEAAALPPTAALPRLRHEPDLRAIQQGLALLTALYGKREAALSEEAQDRLEAAAADHTERAYAMEWLTRVLASGLTWIEETPERDETYEHAAMLLAGCTSALEGGAIERELAFPLEATHPSIRITVRDAALLASDAQSEQGAKEAAAAVGMQTYGSSVILCDGLVTDPGRYYRGLAHELTCSPLTVMELGAGTGIVGMVVAKLLARAAWDVPCHVLLTDYHEDVLANLAYNLATYLPPDAVPHVHVASAPLDWRVVYAHYHPEAGKVPGTIPPSQSASLLLAADVVYDPRHAVWLLTTIQHLLRQPDTDPAARAHILVPIRSAGRLDGVHTTVDTALEKEQPVHGNYRLGVLARRTLPRRGGVGRQDESGYVWTELGWVPTT